ncbi:hypothetical protein ILYODFUR_018798 [Ilyodon furcidens]|uniref:Uncharacterized protein n=1 Tax=Ilyodon furcidens TaxID=33524 RepID=A0ABV0U6H2_9TELE
MHTLIISDLGMTHHMPAPHAPSDFLLACLQISRSPRHSNPSYKFMHLCSSPPYTPPPSRCSFSLKFPVILHFSPVSSDKGQQHRTVLVEAFYFRHTEDNKDHDDE